MPISVKHGGGGIDALSGLLRGQGAYATRESQLRGQDMARIYDKQFQDARLRAQLSSQESIASARNRTQISIAGSSNLATAARNRTQAGVAAAANSAARSRQAASLSAARASQKRSIAAQSQRDNKAADTAYKRAAVAAGLQSELQEQAYDERIKAYEEQARIKAQQTKFQFSMEGKRKIAEGNRIIEFADSELAAGNIDQGQHAEMTQMGRSIRENVNPVAIPDDSEKYEDGQGQKDTWSGSDGSIWGRDANGLPVVRVKYQDTKAGVDAANIEKQQEAAASKIEVKQKEARAYYVKQLGTPMVTGRDPAGKDITRQRSPSEAEAETSNLFPGVDIRGDSAQQVPQQQAPQQQAQEWVAKAEEQGYTVRESDKMFPMQVGIARAAMRTGLLKWGSDRSKWPKEARETYERAQKIVAAFQREILQLDR